MSKLRREEYVALRATIRERGTVRVVTFFVTLLAWAALEAWVLTSGPRDAVPILLTLLVLASGFEAVFQLHVGVERVGRYLQVAFEEAAAPGVAAPRWETTAMAFGRAYPGIGSDPLFSRVFLLATLLNMLPALRAWRTPGLFGVLLGLHALFVVRVAVARVIARGQRADDLERFRALLHESPAPAAPAAAETADPVDPA
jgi:hypothetical protein